MAGKYVSKTNEEMTKSHKIMQSIHFEKYSGVYVMQNGLQLQRKTEENTVCVHDVCQSKPGKTLCQCINMSITKCRLSQQTTVTSNGPCYSTVAFIDL